MNDQEKLKQLYAEVERLSVQIGQCRHELESLRRQIRQLDKEHTGETVPADAYPADDLIPSSHHGALENFIGLRLIHLAGIVILVIGLSIGVKYAIDRELVSEMARIGLAYSAGVVLYVLSLWLKKKYTVFSAILFSGAMASLYFTTYAAFVYYGFFSSFLSFALMVLLTVFTVYEANVYDRQEIALLGLVGAYAIPFLISKNADRVELFFLYISLINSAVVFLGIKKRWKAVTQVAQGITWLLFIGWAAMRFEERVQATGFLFMAFFFLLFLLNALAGKLFYRQNLTAGETWLVVLNNIALCLSSLLLFADTFGRADVAVVCLVLSGFTGLQAFAFYFFWKEEIAVRKMVGALAMVLFAGFIASYWKGFTVTLLWLFAAIVIFAGGVWAKSVFFRMAAMLLMGATLLKLVLLDSMKFSPVQKVISYLVLGILLLVVSFYYQKFRQQLSGNSNEQ